jgi:hypothetical protein
LKKTDDTEFVHLLIENRFYIAHLLSDSLLYLHSDLYSHPDNVSPERYHHKLRMLKAEDDQNFHLVIIKSDLTINTVWILVIKAESWFKRYGITEFRCHFNLT